MKKPIGYYLVESPLGKGFFARTMINDSVKTEELFREAANGREDITAASMKNHTESLITVIERFLSEGKSVTILGFIRLSPAVKGKFESLSDFFTKVKNYVGINCTILKPFTDKFQDKVTVDKVEKPIYSSEIGIIEDNQTGANNLWLDEINRVLGINLLLRDCEFSGIELVNLENVQEKVVASKDNLSVGSFTAKELTFSFKRSFVPPAWLSKGLDISVKLVYTEKTTKVHRESSPYETIWMG